MTDYTAASIPTKIMKDLLKDNWDDLQGHVPIPVIGEVNEPLDEDTPRHDIQSNDLVVIFSDTPGEKETLRNAWEYKDVVHEVILSVRTDESRQRLYDLKNIIRGIIHNNIHDVSGYQIIRYGGFTEFTQEQMNTWEGQIRASFESSGATLDTI